jgi:hypothetical protein
MLRRRATPQSDTAILASGSPSRRTIDCNMAGKPWMAREPALVLRQVSRL